MLVKRSNRPSGPASSAQAATASTFSAPQGLDRRTFLKRSGLAAGAGAIGAGLPFAMVRPADAASDSKAAGAVEMRRSVCTHCSVGCAIDAEVKNGVWVGQEPVFDSPINLGAHCAKGASVREHGHGEHRLRTPMKLHNGKWERLSWDVALKEVSEKLLAIREKDGPDATYWVGSSKHSNEQAYLLRKFVSFWGTNNCDHQARVCHSTTVAGVANTWGYGAMTNSYNDMQNAKAIFFIGSNAAEAHPVSMLHILHAKEGGAKIIVADPRFTRTAAKADHYVRLRSGSDIALIYGVMRHIFENGWDDKKYIEDRVYGMDKIREESMQWTADKVLDVTGVPDDQVHLIAETMAKNKPSTVVWCMGQTQHTTGNAIVRAMCNLQLALGNVGVSGGGTNIFRGHDNVQGATDVGPNPDSLPGYYGIAAGAWKHWCSVWGVDYEWVKGRYASPGLMEKSGITVSRWIDGVLEKNELIDQDSNLKAVVYWGMAPNSQTRGKDMLEAMKALELLVVVDPYPSATAAMAASVRKEGVYLLPAATQFETSGSCTASNRSLQWREKIIEPLFESKPDHTIMYAFAKRFGFEKEFVKNIKLEKDKQGWDEPSMEDTLREINRGTWTIGYSGQSPERLKLHMKHMDTFSVRTLKADSGPCAGDYFGLPWPCYGTPELKHPGTPNLYDTSLHVMEGGGNFRANFGVEKDGASLLAGDGSASKGSDLPFGYPEFDHTLLKKLGWWDELTDAEKKAAEGKNWKTDSSGGIIRVAMKNHGCHPFGNAKARAVVWNFPDPVPKHREALYSTRPDLIDKYPTHEDKKAFWRLPTLYKTVQQQWKNVGKDFPLIMTSGRLVEYEGGGEETRSNPWLAELQQDMFVEINPASAAERGIRDRDWVWVKSPTGSQIKVRALVTPRVGTDTVFLPFHFSGRWMGQDLLNFYPVGAAPIVRGESVNAGTTYGYDVVTMMQETKTTVCQIVKA
ncbi:MAG: formate dehydrogenase subunit alpha [Zoogloea oleivorans]|jgi:formate dehydrogenase major subunit|uniref:formate dehydrogenase subunit alpha n=1 Tax=Zoogloea oleivorans TaxID=1552750 RepID=UPI002A369F5C|nr:formate dehydrogenase subunit alpha [Zoogloea oleivorans]MDY0035948.1 formate dehydrogenase subunit alpha [Zoogloea oleivorans]